MIAFYKLERLPRGQRLRKIASVFAEAERRAANCAAACAGGKCAEISPREFSCLCDMARHLSRDSLFAHSAREAFADAAVVFALSAAPGKAADPADARRALNGARHLLLAETGRSQADWDFLDCGGRLDAARRQPFLGMRVYLDDIRSPFNVGAMFRSAESFGAEKIYVSPLCADPNHARAKRTAMGCVDALPWERRPLFPGPGEAEQAGGGNPRVPVFALETGGIPLAEFPFPRRGLLIAGSEELGVSPRALAAADASLGRVSIPSFGAKGSLNVSVAFGIAMQAWSHRLAGGSR